MEIVFPTSTAPGISPTESGGRLVNCYAEQAPPGSRSKFIWRRTPGLRSVFTVGSDGDEFRGALKFGSTLIVIYGATAYSVTKSAGVYSAVALTGTVDGSGPVIMARNMRSTPQIIIVNSAGMNKIVSGAVTSFTDADLPATNSVAFKDSYFFWGIGDGRSFASANNDITVAGTDYTTAESSPDGLVRVISYADGIMLMGENSIEFWANTAEANGFPFSRSTTIPVGLAGTFAVAGFEEGFPTTIGWVANDNSVRLLSGYTPQRISTPDLERLIAAVDDRTTIEASAYVVSGRPILTISTPDWTWEFDLQDGNWRERTSLATAGRWRARFTVNAFDEWLALDRDTNQVFRIDPTYAREGDDQIVWKLRGIQNHAFPARATINRASFDFKTGVGIDVGLDPIETNPQVAIAWSFDGGVTFGNPLFRSLGPQGKITPIDVWRCGFANRLGAQVELTISDPVDIAFYGGGMDVEARAA